MGGGASAPHRPPQTKSVTRTQPFHGRSAPSYNYSQAIKSNQLRIQRDQARPRTGKGRDELRQVLPLFHVSLQAVFRHSAVDVKICCFSGDDGELKVTQVKHRHLSRGRRSPPRTINQNNNLKKNKKICRNVTRVVVRCLCVKLAELYKTREAQRVS